MWQRITSLIIKELINIWRDPKSRYALIIPPIIQLLVLASAATLEVKNIGVAIYDQDNGQYSRALIHRIKLSPYFPYVYQMTSNAEAKEALNTEKALLVINFQSDFSKRIDDGKSAQVQLLFDGRKSNSAQILEGYLSEIIQDLNHDILKRKQAKEIPVIITPRAWFNPNLDYIFYNVPCLVAILSMLTALTMTSLAVAREREMGTMEQLLVTPFSTWELLVGKTVPAIIVSMGESTLIMFIALIVFQAPFVGSLLLFWLSMLVFVSAMVGVGLFISSLSQTQQQATLGIFIFMTPTILLSGYATPVEYIVPWLQPLSWLFPITYFFIIAKGIFLKDMGVLEVLKYLWPIALIGGFNLLLAAWFFKRRLYTSKD